MSIGSHELVLYADNESSLYPLKMAIFKNLALKKAKGIYSRKLAADFLGKRFGSEAAKKYAKEFGAQGDPWSKLFTSTDRAEAGAEWAEEFEAMFKDGEFEESLPKKSRRKGG